jgi:hypothetical protein
MKSFVMPKKTDAQIEEEMKQLLLGKQRLGSKNWIIQKAMTAIMVKEGLTPDKALIKMVAQYKQNHKDLVSGEKTIEQLKTESVANLKKVQEELK